LVTARKRHRHSPTRDNAEVQHFNVPALGGFEIGCADRNVMAAHVGKWRSDVLWGRDEVSYVTVSWCFEPAPALAHEEKLEH